MPSSLDWTIQYRQSSGSESLPPIIRYDDSTNMYTVYVDNNDYSNQTYALQTTCWVDELSYETSNTVNLYIEYNFDLEVVEPSEPIETPTDDAPAEEVGDDEGNCSGGDCDTDYLEEAQEIVDDVFDEFWGTSQTDLEAALRYYAIYRKMYLLSVSDGPYMVDDLGIEPHLQHFYYKFQGPFVLQFHYYDLSQQADIPQDIILAFVELGPLMTMCSKELYENTRGE